MTPLADAVTAERTCACGCGEPVSLKARYRPQHWNKAQPKRQCSVEGCDEKHAAHGYCRGHYARFRYYGDPLAGSEPRTGESPRLPDTVTAGSATGVAGITYRQFDYWLSQYDPIDADLGFDLQNPGTGIDRQIPRLAVPRIHVLGDQWRKAGETSA